MSTRSSTLSVTGLAVAALLGSALVAGPAAGQDPPELDGDGAPAPIVRRDETTGAVRTVSFASDAGTGTGGEPVDVAGEFLSAEADLLGVARDDLVLDTTVPSPGGAVHVWYDQVLQGLRVHGARVGITVAADGAVAHVASSLVPDLKLVGARRLDAADAIVATGREVGERPDRAVGRLRAAPAAPGRPDGAVRGRSPFETGSDELDEATAEPVAYPTRRGQARLAWETGVPVTAEGFYDAVVDAGTGTVLELDNRWKDNHGPEGNVFTEQHPDIAGADQDITPFPSDWITDDTTVGNNANTWHDPDGDDSPGYRPDTGDPGDAGYQHFNYTYTDAIDTSGGTDWITDRDAVITQAHYYVNMLHDRWYQYGFDEASGNFQEDNFGNGGSDGDRVNVLVDWDIEDGTCCNATMNTPADGSNPWLRLRVGLEPDNLDMHRAMNGDTVTHEFGHGVSNRLVGGGDLGGGVQAGGMGEGWSDAMANTVWNDPVYGEYNNGDTDDGIRSTGYDDSTLTYSDLCSGGCQVHSDGEIWATALWDVREALVNRYGLAAGTFRHEQLMIDGMKNTPTDPTFLDARDGIIASGATIYGGEDTCLLWQAFTEAGLGEDASTSGDRETGFDGVNVPVACIPAADAGGPYAVDEGATIQLDANASAPGTHPSAGDLVTYEWDFDEDGDFDDATGATPTFGPIGDDDARFVSVRVTSSDGIADTATTPLTVENVAPTVTIDSVTADPDEGDTVTVEASFTDPGWLDTHDATVDWGTGDGPVAEPIDSLTPGGPGTPDQGSLTASFTYGDNGPFTITVAVTDDDDGTGSDDVEVAIANVDPTAAIDPAGSEDVFGTPTFLLHAGEELIVSGDTTDPGSDDLTASWHWGDGDTTDTTSLVNPPAADPFPSPSVQPRDLTDTQSHTYGDACLYELVFSVADDDGGVSPDDVAAVVVQGIADDNRSAGYWYQQYRGKTGNLLPLADRECYLEIVDHMSGVFHEVIDVSTFASARDLLKGSGGPTEDKLARQLLAAWLNWANGAMELHELVDTDFDGVADTPFSDAVTTAEEVLLNPVYSDADRLAQEDVLESINLQDH